MMNDYQPIACGAYDELEVLAMRRAQVRIREREGTWVSGRVVDTAIHDGGEYLVLEVAAGTSELRLDRIAEILDSSGTSIWRQKPDETP